jgi:hypothetical protein
MPSPRASFSESIPIVHFDRIGSVDLPDAQDVELVGTAAYVTSGWSGFYIIDVTSPQHPRILSHLDVPTFAYTVRVVGTLAYVTCHAGAACKFLVIDIADPTAPVIHGQYGADTAEVGRVSDIAVVDTTAFVVNEQLEIVDVSDPSQPQLLTTYRTDTGIPARAFNIAVADSVAYLTYRWGVAQHADVGGYVELIDVHDRTHPQLLSRIDTRAGYGITVTKNLAYLTYRHPAGSLQGGLKVIDSTNQRAPYIRADYTGLITPYRFDFWGGFALVADGESGVQVVDVRDATIPGIRSGFDTGLYAHTLDIRGNLIAVADGSGLQLLQTSLWQAIPIPMIVR